jgi:CRP-like cAMP-binding protein
VNAADESFDAFLAALPEVRMAETEEEREAIFAFRYHVYVEELGRKLGNADHGRRRMHDVEDDKPYTALFYVEDEEGVAGTMRVRHWEPGEVPAKDFETFSMERFKGIEQLRTAEIGRLMVRPNRRSGVTLAALGVAAFSVGSVNWQTDLVFANCATGLVRHYGLLGCRRYAGRMIPTPDGIEVPLVMVVSDVEGFHAVGSFLTPLVERAGLDPLDTASFAELFDERNMPVQFDKELVRAAIDSGVAANIGFLSEISAEAIEALVEKGFVIQVPFGELLTEAGLGQRELFVITDGKFESYTEERILRRMYPGEVVDEIGFFSSDGRRTASARCVEGGRVLVLRGRAIDELRVSAPAVAAEILFHLARALADRAGCAPSAPFPTRDLTPASTMRPGMNGSQFVSALASNVGAFR